MQTKTAADAVDFLMSDGMTANSGRTTFNPPTETLVKWLEEKGFKMSDPANFEAELVSRGFHLMPIDTKDYSVVRIGIDYPALQQHIDAMQKAIRERDDDDFWEWVVDSTYETIKDGDKSEPKHSEEYGIEFSNMIPLKLVFDEYVLGVLMDGIADDYYKKLLQTHFAFDRFVNAFFGRYDYRPLYDEDGKVMAIANSIGGIDYGAAVAEMEEDGGGAPVSRQQRRKLERERKKRLRRK